MLVLDYHLNPNEFNRKYSIISTSKFANISLKDSEFSWKFEFTISKLIHEELKTYWVIHYLI